MSMALKATFTGKFAGKFTGKFAGKFAGTLISLRNESHLIL